MTGVLKTVSACCQPLTGGELVEQSEEQSRSDEDAGFTGN